MSLLQEPSDEEVRRHCHLALAAALAVQPLLGAGAPTPLNRWTSRQFRETRTSSRPSGPRPSGSAKSSRPSSPSSTTTAWGRGRTSRCSGRSRACWPTCRTRRWRGWSSCSARPARTRRPRRRSPRRSAGRRRSSSSSGSCCSSTTGSSSFTSSRSASPSSPAGRRTQGGQAARPSANGPSLDRFDEGQKISLSVQRTSRPAIRDEAMGVISKLGAVGQGHRQLDAERLNESIKAAKKGKTRGVAEEQRRGAQGGQPLRAARSQKTVATSSASFRARRAAEGRAGDLRQAARRARAHRVSSSGTTIAQSRRRCPATRARRPKSSTSTPRTSRGISSTARTWCSGTSSTSCRWRRSS